ncbi:DUF6093 family protein [Nocardioides bruguierae]|uniref:DUF6093 family protein n=1 Tax=Nocardioides bruguierae TaxID=2945102 RepID=UPI002021E465|nr:DUF6093 family protein [Nocardioides bruguierae]MCL8026315.1 DUF6093 family protein [Nocardioides bruguierae]
MPRPTRAHGRPGTPVIPTSWAADHQPVAEATMISALALYRQDAPTRQEWDPAEQQQMAIPPGAYDTRPCRVIAMAAQARTVEVVADDETVARYLVTTTVDVSDTPTLQPAEGDTAVCTDTGDPLIEGRTLRVEQILRGTHQFERGLVCTLTD